MNAGIDFLIYFAEKKIEFKSFVLLFARFSGIISFGPLTGSRIVPFAVRISIALALSLPMYGVQISGLGENLFFNIILQLFYGILLGWISSLIFQAFQSAGRIVDDARGMAQVALIDPSLSASTTAGGLLFYLIASLLFFKTGAYELFLSAMYKTLHQPASWILPEFRVIFIARNFFTTTLLLSAPFLIVFLVTDLLFGILNRSMPGLNVYFLLHQVKILLGVFVLFVIIYNLNESEEFFVFHFQKFLFILSP